MRLHPYQHKQAEEREQTALRGQIFTSVRLDPKTALCLLSAALTQCWNKPTLSTSALSLSKPSESQSTHNMGWIQNRRLLVQSLAWERSWQGHWKRWEHVRPGIVGLDASHRLRGVYGMCCAQPDVLPLSRIGRLFFSLPGRHTLCVFFSRWPHMCVVCSCGHLIGNEGWAFNAVQYTG